jgi:hypothetical protein
VARLDLHHRQFDRFARDVADAHVILTPTMIRAGSWSIWPSRSPTAQGRYGHPVEDPLGPPAPSAPAPDRGRLAGLAGVHRLG